MPIICSKNFPKLVFTHWHRWQCNLSRNTTTLFQFTVQGASSAHSLPDGSKSEDRTRDAMHQTQNTKVIPMCIVIGGMDTEGEMFDDTLVMVLDEI